jgi:hypothetical protein
LLLKRRLSPLRRHPPEVRQGAILGRGVFDDNVRDAIAGVSAFKVVKNRPFPPSEVIQVLESIGWIRYGRSSSDAPADERKRKV